MARLWSCGFELQSATAGVEWDTNNGSPTISTSITRGGAASLRCNPSSATMYIQHGIFSTSTVARTFSRADLYIASLPTVDTTILSWTDVSTPYEGIQLKTDGTLQFRNSAAASGSVSAALAIGRWCRIELDYNDSSVSAGVANLYLDGTLFSTITGLGLNGGQRIKVGPQVATTCDLYFDNVAINDTSGTAQTGLCGDGRIVHLYPAGQGDNNGFETAVGGTAGQASNWTRVAELTPDDSTSYNQTIISGSTTIDDFVCGTPAGVGITAWDTVTLVAVGSRVGSNSTTTAAMTFRLKGQAGGTLLESASTSCAVNGWVTHQNGSLHLYRVTAYTNPQTSAAWTPNDLNTVQVGYRNNASQTTQRRVSTVWALVEFVPQPIPARSLVVNGAALTRAGSW